MVKVPIEVFAKLLSSSLTLKKNSQSPMYAPVAQVFGKVTLTFIPLTVELQLSRVQVDSLTFL